MLKKLRTFMAMIAVPATLAVLAIAPATVSAYNLSTAADLTGGVCSGSSPESSSFSITGNGSTGCTTTVNSSSVSHTISTVVNIFSVIVGVIAVIMIIVGGLKYITSGGESNKVGSAKNTLLFAIVGLVIVALAQIIVHFVLAKSGSAIGGS